MTSSPFMIPNLARMIMVVVAVRGEGIVGEAHSFRRRG
jgi:hypothetical protein